MCLVFYKVTSNEAGERGNRRSRGEDILWRTAFARVRRKALEKVKAVTSVML
jgi:hypothetical protein